MAVNYFRKKTLLLMFHGVLNTTVIILLTNYLILHQNIQIQLKKFD